MKKILETIKEKWSEYLLEMIVIVIGILVAFGLNNWNENRKNRLNDLEFLMSLKSELSTDLKVIQEMRNSCLEINQQIVRAIYFLKNSTSLSQSQYDTISYALRKVPQLTPFRKNTKRNDLLIADGTLLRLDEVLHKRYLEYLEESEYSASIFTKAGERLQDIHIQYVLPKIDFDMIDNRRANYTFDEIKDDRLVNNALQHSLNIRRAYISFLDSQVASSEELLAMVNSISP